MRDRSGKAGDGAEDRWAHFEGPMNLLPRLTATLIVYLLIIPLMEAGALHAEEAPGLDSPTRVRIVEWISNKLNERFLFPDVAEEMEKHIRKRLAAGEYDGIDNIRDFGRVLTRDLRSICNDEHLWVSYNPNSSPPVESTAEEKALFQRARLERERAENFHFRKVEILSGNVGYLRFDEFSDARWAGDTAVAAMRFLANCDALIIDLRYNGGGHSTMVQLLMGHFFDDSTHYNSFYIREEDKTTQDWSQAWVPGPKLLDQDVYVLVGGKYTFSAAEAFAFAMQKLERGTVVGETTRGGAHAVKYVYMLDLGLELKIPYARGYDPESGDDYEGVGVQPDFEVPEDEAREKAHVLALKKLYDKADDEQKPARKWIWEYQHAVTSPAEIPTDLLRQYTGRYGPVEVKLENGRLMLLEPGHTQWRRFCALNQTLFVVEDNVEIRGEYELDEASKVVAMQGITRDGRRMRFPKAD